MTQYRMDPLLVKQLPPTATNVVDMPPVLDPVFNAVAHAADHELLLVLVEGFVIDVKDQYS